MSDNNRRARLYKAVESGRLTPIQADTIASRRGLEPITPSSPYLDPLSMPRWTLPMAAAYLAWGVPAAERYIPEKQSYYWRDNGRGMSLELARPHTALSDLSVDAAVRQGQGESGAMEVIEKTIEQLWAWLVVGKLTPTAYDPSGRFCRLDKTDMANLQEHISIQVRGAYSYRGAPSVIAFSNLTIDRDELLTLCPAGTGSVEVTEGLPPIEELVRLTELEHARQVEQHEQNPKGELPKRYTAALAVGSRFEAFGKPASIARRIVNNFDKLAQKPVNRRYTD